MPKRKASDASKAPVTAELMGEFAVEASSITTSTPSKEGRNEKPFECPLCIDVFKLFSQLKWHLMSMHPRREFIMELIKERYGVSKGDKGLSESATVDSQNPHGEPSACSSQIAEKLQQPVVVETGMVTEVFKVPKVPQKLRHRAPASPQIKTDQCKTSCREPTEGSMKDELVPKISSSEESSLWDSYLSFCLSSSE